MLFFEMEEVPVSIFPVFSCFEGIVKKPENLPRSEHFLSQVWLRRHLQQQFGRENCSNNVGRICQTDFPI